MAAEDAFFFEYEGGRLFAVLHAPEGPPSGIGVVLCHPYGEERQFTDRVLVRFGRRLAASGHGALRFDHLGCGDSEDSSEEGTVRSRVAETLKAAAVLKARLGLDHVLLLGIRLGGTVAALAAESDPSVSGLVLWSPIVFGRRYADELLRKKLFAQIAAGGGSVGPGKVLETLKTEGRLELEGGYLTLRMYEDMSGIDLSQQVAGFVRPVITTTVARRHGNYSPYEAVTAAYGASGAPAEFHVIGDREYWDDRSMFERVFPTALYDATLRWLDARYQRQG